MDHYIGCCEAGVETKSAIPDLASEEDLEHQPSFRKWTIQDKYGNTHPPVAGNSLDTNPHDCMRTTRFLS
jgi:hypothetical protein